MTPKKSKEVEEPERSQRPLEALIATHEQTAALAYALREERGCPDGSLQEDWFRAEREIAARSAGTNESENDDGRSKL
jgi:hypothetical protein